MTVKCGNCHGTHASAADVRQCYVSTSKIADAVKATLSVPPDKEELEMEAAVTHTATIPNVQTKLSGMPKVERSKIPAHLKREDKQGGLKFTDIGEPNLAGDQVMDGRYSVVMDGEQVTLRFHTPAMGKFKGTQLVTYLYGPDNTESGDWVRFANRTGDGYRVWGRFLNTVRLINALRHMTGASVDELINCGEAYALESSNCWRCGRDLTREDSITRGMGAICAGKVLG
jgi:Family of unknown function (DUF6011)